MPPATEEPGLVPATLPAHRTGDTSMQPIQSIERAAAVLASISRGDETGRRMIDIADEVGLQKSTVHRILGTLEQLGYVDRDGSTSRYYLGYGLFSLGLTAIHRFGLARLAGDATRRLAELTSDTVFLSVRYGSNALCIDRVVGTYPIKTLTLEVGTLRPLGVGAGSLALLAWLPDEEIKTILDANRRALDPFPAFGAEQIMGLVEESRRTGYSYNPGLILGGMNAVGVPVLGRDEAPIAALSVAAIESRMEIERRRQIVDWLQHEAHTLEAKLGGPDGITDSDLRHLVPPSQ